MIKAALGSLLLIGSLFCMAAYADVPPDPGYVRQTVSVTLEPKADFSDYRFFIESPMRMEEIAIEKDKETVIDGTARVGAARIGTLWAIPRKAIDTDVDFSSTEKLQSFRQALSQGQYHAIKVITLDFLATVREADRSNWRDPVYQLNKSPDGVTASLVSGGVQQNASRGPQLYSTEPKSSAFWTAVLIGGLLTAAFIAAGAWALRRSRLRASETDSFTR